MLQHKMSHKKCAPTGAYQLTRPGNESSTINPKTEKTNSQVIRRQFN